LIPTLVVICFLLVVLSVPSLLAAPA